MRLRLAQSDGATLAEVIISVALALLCMGSLFAMNTSGMATLKMGRESAWASQVLQQRIESLRIANWHQITDSAWLKSNMLNTDASASAALKSESETLELFPYGSATTGQLTLSKTKGQAATITQDNPSSPLLAENAVKIRWTVSYTAAPGNRTMTRQTVTIVASGGVAK